jgi:hypothetical protein
VSEVLIYGASDDLIELEGDISEEFSYDDDHTNYVAFSDGTVLTINYGNDGGFWRINRIVTGSATYQKTEATDDAGEYSDRVTLSGDLKWAVFGTGYAKTTNLATG